MTHSAILNTVEETIILSSINIAECDYQDATSQIWRISGTLKTGEIENTVGYLAVTACTRIFENMTIICGGISHAYDIIITGDEMRDLLRSHFSGKLGIDEADCFFVWRSGSVTYGWFHNNLFSPKDSKASDEP